MFTVPSNVPYLLALQMRIAINEGRSFSMWSPLLFGNQNAQLETPNWFLPALLNEGQQQ